jgi:hypothetical protein
VQYEDRSQDTPIQGLLHATRDMETDIQGWLLIATLADGTSVRIAGQGVLPTVTDLAVALAEIYSDTEQDCE